MRRREAALGSLDEYREILRMVDAPRAFLDRLMAKEFFIPDQWCAQETYQVIDDYNVWVHTEGLCDADLERYHMHPVADLHHAVARMLERHGPDARWAVVPDGPMVILQLAG